MDELMEAKAEKLAASGNVIESTAVTPYPS